MGTAVRKTNAVLELKQTSYLLLSTVSKAIVCKLTAAANMPSTRTIALPSSAGLVAFHNAVIPEYAIAMTTNEVMEVL